MFMGFALFLLAAGIVGGLLVLQFLASNAAPTATVHVLVDHEGDILFNGTVEVMNATALAALKAAATAGDFDMQVRQYPGQGAYVTRIGPYAEEGDEGWLYCVGRDPCTHPQVAADRYALQPGDAVTWHWGTADDGLT